LVQNFIADHVAGALPQVLNAVTAANTGTANSYGVDEYSQQVKAQLSDIFETPVEILFVTTGTASNALALACLTPPYGMR
jgi:threonine aldolase